MGLLSKKVSKLSQLVDLKLKEGYPHLLPKWMLWQWISRLLRQNVILVGAILLIPIFVFVNELSINSKYIIIVYATTLDDASTVLTASLSYVVGVIAIVIPVLFLIAQFVVSDRKAGSIADVVINRTGIRKLINLSLIMLVLHILAVNIVHLNIFSSPSILFYSLCSFAILDLMLVYEIAIAINKLSKTFHSDFILDVLLDEISTRLHSELFEEAKRRLAHNIYVELQKEYGLAYRSSYWHPSKSMQPVFPTLHGYIIDIRLPKLRKLFGLKIDSDLSSHIIVTKSLGDRIHPSEPIGYLSNKVNLDAVARLMRSAFIVSVNGKTSQNDLPRLLDQLKEVGRASIIEANLTDFVNIIQIYERVLFNAFAGDLPESSELTSSLFGWSGHRTILYDLDELTEIAAEQSNARFIKSIAEAIYDVSMPFLYRFDDQANKSLATLLEHNVAIYRESYSNKNDEGIFFSYAYMSVLANSHLNGHLIELLRNNIADPDIVEHIIQKIHIIYGVLIRLAHGAFLKQDWVTLGKLLHNMQPQECLSHLDLVLQEGYAIGLEHRLLQRHEESSTDSEIAMHTLVSAKDIPSQIKLLHQKLVLFVLATALKQYDLSELSLEDAQKVAKATQPFIPTFEDYIAILLQYEKKSFDGISHLFAIRPETNSVHSVDYTGNLYLLYAVHGIKNIGEFQQNNPLAYRLDGVINSLKSWNQYITDSPEKWSRFLALSSSEIAPRSEQFLGLNQQIEQNYRLQRARTLTNASVTGERANWIIQTIQVTLENPSALQKLVLHDSKVFDELNLDHDKEVTTSLTLSKDILAEDSLVSLAHDPFTFQQVAGNLQIQFDYFLAHQLLDMAPECESDETWNTIENYFDAALSHLSAQGFSANCLLIPTLYENTQPILLSKNLEDLIEQSSRVSNRYGSQFAFGQIGALDENIAIIGYRCSFKKHPYLLFVDLDHAIDIRASNPLIQIKDLSDEIKQKVLAAKEYSEDLEQLLQAKIDVSQKIRIVERNPLAVVKIKLKLAELKS